MEIRVAEHAGTCFGVDKAMKLAFDAASSKKNVHILGELVHNPHVCRMLSDQGVISETDLTRLEKGDVLIIRAHGEPDAVISHCNKNGIEVVDCTCPLVQNIYKQAGKLQQDGHTVILVGQKDHPEVKGVLARVGDICVVESEHEIDETIKEKKKIAVISQTTQTMDNFNSIVAKIMKYNPDVKVCNTICDATKHRQESAMKLCDDVDVMVVIGGKNSANTKSLYELCSRKIRTIWIDSPEQIDAGWFSGADTVGITAGASTPVFIIEDAIKIIKSHI